MLKTILAFIIGCGLLVSANHKCLSQEDKDILRHMSLVELDDGQGGTNTTIRIVNANLQIVNGTGTTATKNGRGNLIVGYNEPNAPLTVNRTGSHTIVVGERNNYASWGGLVAGRRNQIFGPFSTITGGAENRTGSSATASSISGGSFGEVLSVDDWVAGTLFEED